MVLFVENDTLAIRPLIDYLRESGYDVEVRNHADRALADMPGMQNLRCAILDVMMPAPGDWGDDALGGMATGLVLARKIRESNSALPIIFLTGQNSLAVNSSLRDFPKPSKCFGKLHLRADALLAAVQEMAGQPDSTAISTPEVAQV